MLGKKNLTKGKKDSKKEEGQPISLTEDCLKVLEHKTFDCEPIFHEIKADVAKLKKELDKGKPAGRLAQLSSIEPVMVAQLLRHSLLEKPLIGSEFYDSFRGFNDKLNDVEESIKLIRDFVGNLGEVKVILYHLLALLKRISPHPDKNKIDTQKMTLIFSSCIIKKKSIAGALEPNEDPGIRAVVNFMIIHCEAIFGGERESVPSESHQTQQVTETEEEEESPVEVDETQDSMKKLFYVFAPDVYESYAKMMACARDRNVMIDVPQLCIMGEPGHGKTAFFESFLGHGFSGLKNRSTKRPVVINIVNNPQAIKPLVKFKADLTGTFGDEEMSLSLVSAEMDRRNIATDIPIYVTYEYNLCFNLVVIDTPPVNFDDPSANINKLLLETAQSSTFVVYCFKEAIEERMIEFAQKADPKLVKTTFVHTDFYSNLKNYVSTSYLNQYIAYCCQSEAPTFLTTLNSDFTEESGEEVGGLFKSKLWQSQQVDFALLDRLSYDKRFEARVGIFKCRKILIEALWKRYQDLLPEVPKNIAQAQKQCEMQMKLVAHKLKHSEANKLREVATSYTIDFLGNIEKLMVGSLEGVPAVNGQTLDEEKSQQQDITSWNGSNFRPVTLKEEVTVSTAGAKLYGKQQFERVLGEFKAVAEHMAFSPLTMDDVATAAGTFSIGHKNLSLFAWVASDLASKNATSVFTPLIEELHRRLLYVMLRALTIADAMQGYKTKVDPGAKPAAKTNSSTLQVKYDFHEFPYLTSTVKHFYTAFVHECAETAKQKSLQELYCTKILYWEHRNFSEKKLVSQDIKTAEEARKAVVVLTTEMFNDIRKRLTRNIMMKYYEYLLVPVQTRLSQIQNKVTYLADQQIDELFQVQVLRRNLTQEDSKLRQQMGKLREQHQTFVENANKFKKGAILT